MGFLKLWGLRTGLLSRLGGFELYAYLQAMRIVHISGDKGRRYREFVIQYITKACRQYIFNVGVKCVVVLCLVQNFTRRQNIV